MRTPTVRAYSLCNDPMSINLKSGFFGNCPIKLFSIIHGNIHHGTAPHANQVVMQVCPAVVPIRTGNSYMADFPVIGQAVEVAVNRSATDPTVYSADILIYLVSTRVIVTSLHSIQDNLTLSGFSSLFRFATLPSKIRVQMCFDQCNG